MPPREHEGSAGDDRDARLPRGAQGMSWQSADAPPMPSRLRGDSKRSTLCETGAAEPGRGLSCPQGRVPWVLRELLWPEPALVSKAVASPPHAAPWPRDPCAIASCSPRRPEPAAGAGPSHRRGYRSSSRCHRPPVPRRALRQPRRGACSEQPWAESRRRPRGGGPGEAAPASPQRREVERQTAAAAATRDNRVATVQSHTTDGNMQRDTGSARQTNSPTWR